MGASSDEPAKKKTRAQQLQEWKQQKAEQQQQQQCKRGSPVIAKPVLATPVVQVSLAPSPCSAASSPNVLQTVQQSQVNAQRASMTGFAAAQAPPGQSMGKSAGAAKRRSAAPPPPPAPCPAATKDVDILKLLRSHNSKVRAASAPMAGPAPRTHSVKDIREWEKRTAKKWANLTHAERWEANQEINDIIAEQQVVAAL